MVDVTRYVFIVEDLHLLLLAGLPAHYRAAETLTLDRYASWPGSTGSSAYAQFASSDGPVEPGHDVCQCFGRLVLLEPDRGGRANEFSPLPHHTIVNPPDTEMVCPVM